MLRTMMRWSSVALLVGMLPLWGCGGHESHAAHHPHPATVEHIDGSELSRVTLTEKAIERIALETAELSERQLDGATYKVVPYSSIIYDPQGRTWVYTSPQPRTFVRAEIDVHRIEGDSVYLNDGPAVGTVVASVGVAEVYGSEFEVGH
jgi:hypothetical protein